MPDWRQEIPLADLVHERVVALTDSRGRRFDLARVYAEEQPGGTWQGWIEFRSADGATATTDRETTQSHRAGIAYWAEGLEAVYLEGALRRAVER